MRWLGAVVFLMACGDGGGSQDMAGNDLSPVGLPADMTVSPDLSGLVCEPACPAGTRCTVDGCVPDSNDKPDLATDPHTPPDLD